MALTPAYNPFYKDSLRAQEVQRKALGYQPMPDYQIAGERYGELSAELQDKRSREQLEEMMDYRNRALTSQTDYQTGMLDLLNEKFKSEEGGNKIEGINTLIDMFGKLFGGLGGGLLGGTGGGLLGPGSLIGGTTGVFGQGGLLGAVGSGVGAIGKALMPGTKTPPAIQTTTGDPYDPRYGMGTYEPPPEGYDPNISGPGMGVYEPPPLPDYNPAMDWGMESFTDNSGTSYLLTDEGYQATFGSMEGTVICTELYRQGLLDEKTYRADSAYGALLDDEILVGYHFWAEGIANRMKDSKILTKIVSIFAIPWAKEMSFRFGVGKKGNLLGRMINLVGIPLCGIIGSVIMNKEVEYA